MNRNQAQAVEIAADVAAPVAVVALAVDRHQQKTYHQATA